MAETPQEPISENRFLQMYAEDPTAWRGMLEDSLSSRDPNTGMSMLGQMAGTGLAGGLGLLAGRGLAKPISQMLRKRVPDGNLLHYPMTKQMGAAEALRHADYAEVGLPAGLATAGAIGGFFAGDRLTMGEERAPMDEFRAIMGEIEAGDLSAVEKKKAYEVLEKGLEARDAASPGIVGLLAGLAAAGITLPRVMRRGGYIDGAVTGRQGKKALEDVLDKEGLMSPDRYAKEADAYIAAHAQQVADSGWWSRQMAGGDAQNKGVADAMHNRVNLTNAVTKDEGQALLEDMAATGFGVGVGGLAASDYENPLAGQ